MIIPAASGDQRNDNILTAKLNLVAVGVRDETVCSSDEGAFIPPRNLKKMNVTRSVKYETTEYG